MKKMRTYWIARGYIKFGFGIREKVRQYLMADLVIGVVVAAAVAAVIWKKVKDARAGKPGCGCGCAGCTGHPGAKGCQK